MAITVRHLPVRFALPAGALALALGLSSCAFKTDKEKPVDPRTTALQEQLDSKRPILKSDFKFKFIPRELNQYWAQVSWPTGRPIQLTVRYADGTTENFDVRNHGSFTAPCVAGILKFNAKSGIPGQDAMNDFPISVECPKDLLIKGKFSDANELKSVNGRLEFDVGARVELGSSPLDINVDQLILHDTASIVTFDKTRASTLRSGPVTTAPEIRIKAKFASGGELSLELNGVDGSALADPLDIESPDRNGAKGTDGEYETYIPSLGPKGPDGAAARTRCSKKPGAGEDGKPALQAVGKPGTRGNDAIGLSTVTLDIAEHRQFSIKVFFNPGFGSQGKRGAIYKGGKGGIGGEAPEPCKRAASGKDGDVSPAQRSPGDGNNGGCGKIFASKSIGYKISKENIGDAKCSQSPRLVEEF
ncbi:hypothetical protein BH10BDE1_BH10BDE1_08500 [soil metagenome]